MIDLDSRCDQTEGMQDMGKRARLKWPPRTRVTTKGRLKTTKIDPLYGPALYDHQELHNRLVHRKAF